MLSMLSAITEPFHDYRGFDNYRKWRYILYNMYRHSLYTKINFHATINFIQFYFHGINNALMHPAYLLPEVGFLRSHILIIWINKDCSRHRLISVIHQRHIKVKRHTRLSHICLISLNIGITRRGKTITLISKKTITINIKGIHCLIRLPV